MENEIARLEQLLEQLIELHQTDHQTLLQLREQHVALETARQEEVQALQAAREEELAALAADRDAQVAALRQEMDERVHALETSNRELSDKVRFASERLEALLEKMPEA